MEIFGEISKRPLSEEREKKHFESVNMQMGRVQLDSDWNEAFETLLKARARALNDTVGRYGSPNDGFRIDSSLILDHMDSKDGWSPKGQIEIEYLEKFEGKGSFRINGNVALGRHIPELLRQLSTLQEILYDEDEKDATIDLKTPPTPKLKLQCKVSALSSATIKLSIKGKNTGTVEKTFTVPCGNWQTLGWDMPNVDLSSYDTFAIDVETSGIVYLDYLALDPGMIKDVFKDFYIHGGDGTSDGAGRYYVDGLACVKERFETYLTQKDYPEPPAINLNDSKKRLAYLDVWKRTITAVEDKDILEAALGGPDTCTREQLIAQVKVIEASDCKSDITSLIRKNKTGALTAKLSPKAEEEKCSFKPELDYTGLNNSLYRIEIHDAGGVNTARFKWSRNNGADLVPVVEFSGTDAVIIPDDRILCCGDLVELCDDVSDLADFSRTEKHGKLANIKAIDHVDKGVKITLDFTVDKAADKTTAPFKDRDVQIRHPKLRKWHGVENVNEYKEFDVDGTPKKELEHGIRIAFSSDHYYHGDYWQFTARVNTRSIEELENALPMGPEHHYAPLSIIKLKGVDIFFESCRKVFPPLTDLNASDIEFDSGVCGTMEDLGVNNVQQAIEVLCKHYGCCDQVVIPGQSIKDAIYRIGPEGGCVYLSPGVHIVKQTIKIKNFKNLIIRGDGRTTIVVYLPEEPSGEPQDIKDLKEKIKGIKEKIKTEADAAKKKELEKQLYELEKQFAVAQSEYMQDLFRIESSNNITLENFLMLSFGADSLVAVLDDSKYVSVEGCDILDLGVIKRGSGFFKKSLNLSKEEFLEAKTEFREKAAAGLNSCIRMTDCCEITVENNRFAGGICLLQSYAADVSKTPHVNGLKCSNNRILVDRAGILITEGEGILIRDNSILCAETILKEKDKKALGELLEKLFPLNNQCIAESYKEINDFIDALISALFGCLPEIKPELCAGISAMRAYIMRKSFIGQNRFAGREGIFIFYSERNEIVGNQIMCSSTALSLPYSFNTKISENILETVKYQPASSQEPNPTQPAVIPGDIIIISESESVSIAATAREMSAAKKSALAGAVKETAAKLDAGSDIMRGTTPEDKEYIKSGNVYRRLNIADYPATVALHFADRLNISGNDIKGVIGLRVEELSAKQFLTYLTFFATLSDSPLKDEARLLSAKRFAELMGLKPTIHLIETIAKIFSGGEEDVDLIALLLEAWLKGEIPQKGVIVKLLFDLFTFMLEMRVVSRSLISENRFDVDSFGIHMEEYISFGGTRIINNRLSGASQTAILMKALPILSNPELNGLLLNCAYAIIIKLLELLKGFLNMLIGFLEQLPGMATTVSPLMVFIAASTLYGIGETCPSKEMATESGSAATTPENPYIKLIQDIIDAIDGVLEQLESESVRKNVSDLASNDYRISLNQIKGKGNGIHTNIANSVLESNRIDIEPGYSAIAEIFSIGRILSTHNKVLNDGSASSKVDHSAVAFLGVALMSVNPYALEASEEGLKGKTSQWDGLDDVITEIIDMVKDVDIASNIHDKATALKQNHSEDNSTAFIRAIKEHLTGYGMILESPGMQVINNRIEAVEACNLPGLGSYGWMPAGRYAKANILWNTTTGAGTTAKDMEETEKSRRAPGGILMTADNDSASLVMYMLLLLEEAFSIANLGGQGTRFSGNSIQWGTGHGLSLSSLLFMVDCKIENNEIQNHGLAGILYMPYLSYKLNITENEINQCFVNNAFNINSSDVAFPTMLGGAMVFNADELNCSDNNIRGCGNKQDGWPANGIILINCKNLSFHDNNIIENGKTLIQSENTQELLLPRGGVLVVNGVEKLNINNNKVYGNKGWALRLFKHDKTDWSANTSIIFTGNRIEIEEAKNFAPLFICTSLELLFSNNQIVIPASTNPIKGVKLIAKDILFNNNQVIGNNQSFDVRLKAVVKGLAIGNMLHKQLVVSSNITVEHNMP